MVVALAGAAALLAGCGGGSSPARATEPAAQRAPAVRPAAVLATPTRVADTAAGAVGYREIGTGSPVLLITGLSGSMDDWPPAFVASLAAGHEVIQLDNAGVGRTASLTSPLSITGMADQTSDLISALRLGRVAVLGWSMGGMIAQALAVLHPAQVSRIVLAATQPGTGHAVPVPPAAAAAVVSRNPAAVISVLFPPADTAAIEAYETGIAGYPDPYRAPAPVVAAQANAVGQWVAGKDPAGPRFGTVRVPLLVADGTLDELDPSANDRSLAASVPGAKLILYSGAGHGFLFQDMTRFLPAVGRFLH
jgi:pimeloyl-ACP methyl ester carboxylesterase